MIMGGGVEHDISGMALDEREMRVLGYDMRNFLLLLSF